MHYCDCGDYFYDWNALKEHWVQSPRHDYCQYCNEHVGHILDHYEECHHYCGPCRRVFRSEFGLHEHLRQSERHRDMYCGSCRRLFMSPNNLNAHLNSSIHRTKDVICPFKCGATFVSNSALVLHLENGGCKSGINQTIINRYVREYDTNNVITDPSRMITGGSSVGDITYIATERSWNGCGYECVLCHKVHHSLLSLNQHLASPKHKDKIYICRGPDCSMRFPALSGLVQHVESNKCGVARFKSVQNAMNSMLGQVGRITM
ncbi:hypothetical protein JR316_0000196 [Psilocybe cubensis]|uniref:Uncharacterized protein n=2 Tax=Psilocybe cubensis TaxID=181762 RepID=A0ACB8HEQ7_PSICU|nr:hypothetical protein JR316_0000196 [Psilocybe cubensis]KAH9486132.1 hypothetical protein JR316_0000196 [Psilocybe cubensis]